MKHHIGGFGADGGCHLRSGTRQRDAVIAAGVFILQNSIELPDKVFKCLLIAGRDRHRRLTAGADHIVKLAAGYRRQTQAREPLHATVQHAPHHLVAAGAAQMDVRPGMASLQAGEGNGITGHPRHRLHNAGQMTVGPHTTGAGNGKHALDLRIQVQQFLTLQIGTVQREGTVHAHFLIHGEHRLDRRMRQRVVRQYRQDHSHGNPVVSAQRGFVRPDPLTVRHQIQALDSHILGAVIGLGTDHVDVALQNNGRRVLISGRGIFPDDDIVAGLLTVPQAQFPGKAHAHVADDLGIAAAVGYGTELFKIVKYLFRLQSG